MKAMVKVLISGFANSGATALFPAEAVQAFTPFAVLSTTVMLLAYWVVAGDHTPTRTDAVYRKAA